VCDKPALCVGVGAKKKKKRTEDEKKLWKAEKKEFTGCILAVLKSDVSTASLFDSTASPSNRMSSFFV
jgi:hypothetical protein